MAFASPPKGRQARLILTIESRWGREPVFGAGTPTMDGGRFRPLHTNLEAERERSLWGIRLGPPQPIIDWSDSVYSRNEGRFLVPHWFQLT